MRWKWDCFWYGHDWDCQYSHACDGDHTCRRCARKGIARERRIGS